MADAFDMLDDLSARLRAFPKVAKEAAPAVANAVEVEVRRQIGAGTDPNGRPWKARRDGERALATAADGVGVAAVGNRIVIRAWGHVARHNNGRAKGGITRQIVPTGPLPLRLSDVVRKQVLAAIAKHLGVSP